MARKKASKQYDEDEEFLEKRSVNYQEDEADQEEIMGINAALEREKEQQEDQTQKKEIEEQQQELMEWKAQEEEAEAANKGISLPPAYAKRDPKKDKDPLEGEDLGLDENDFLLSRKVTELDLDIHNEVNEDGLLGSNVRKPKEFLSIFSRGRSTNEAPKIDTTFTIENNSLMQKELASRQILNNYHSRDNKEKSNALNILKELELDEDEIKEIKSKRNASSDQDLVDLLKELL